MKIVRLTTLAALAIATSMTLAHAQSAQDHNAHQPAAPGAAQAQPAAPPAGGMQHHMMMGGNQGMKHGGTASPMMQSMQKMQQAMAATPVTGNPDRDFATMMIPHHQGAIDMAREQLMNGKSPEMRSLAERIIKAQEDEIKEIKTWLEKNPAK